MASIMIKYPNQRTEQKEVITAYKATDTTEYIVFKTGKVENNNEVVGVSYKPANEDCFSKIVDAEEWKKAKGLLVDDLHDKKTDFTYALPEGEINVTEDFMHDLALRDANLSKLKSNYAEFLSTQTKTEEEPVINPFETPVMESAPTIEAEPVLEPITPEPIPVESVVEQQSVEPQANIEEQPSLETPQPQENSIVAKSYVETAGELIEQVKEITNKYIKTMEEMKEEIGRQLEEAYKINELSKQTFDNAQQILNQNNDDVTKNLTKAA